jgi:hypothetical protein
MDELRLALVQRLIARLERLSADSVWAHRASGLRGSLLRYVEHIETGTDLKKEEMDQFEHMVELGFAILEQAAKEMGARK